MCTKAFLFLKLVCAETSMEPVEESGWPVLPSTVTATSGAKGSPNKATPSRRVLTSHRSSGSIGRHHTNAATSNTKDGGNGSRRGRSALGGAQVMIGKKSEDKDGGNGNGRADTNDSDFGDPLPPSVAALVAAASAGPRSVSFSPILLSPPPTKASPSPSDDGGSDFNSNSGTPIGAPWMNDDTPELVAAPLPSTDLDNDDNNNDHTRRSLHLHAALLGPSATDHIVAGERSIGGRHVGQISSSRSSPHRNAAIAATTVTATQLTGSEYLRYHYTTSGVGVTPNMSHVPPTIPDRRYARDRTAHLHLASPNTSARLVNAGTAMTTTTTVDDRSATKHQPTWRRWKASPPPNAPKKRTASLQVQQPTARARPNASLYPTSNTVTNNGSSVPLSPTRAQHPPQPFVSPIPPSVAANYFDAVIAEQMQLRASPTHVTVHDTVTTTITESPPVQSTVVADVPSTTATTTANEPDHTFMTSVDTSNVPMDGIADTTTTTTTETRTTSLSIQPNWPVAIPSSSTAVVVANATSIPAAIASLQSSPLRHRTSSLSPSRQPTLPLPLMIEPSSSMSVTRPIARYHAGTNWNLPRGSGVGTTPLFRMSPSDRVVSIPHSTLPSRDLLASLAASEALQAATAAARNHDLDAQRYKEQQDAELLQHIAQRQKHARAHARRKRGEAATATSQAADATTEQKEQLWSRIEKQQMEAAIASGSSRKLTNEAIPHALLTNNPAVTATRDRTYSVVSTSTVSSSNNSSQRRLTLPKENAKQNNGGGRRRRRRSLVLPNAEPPSDIHPPQTARVLRQFRANLHINPLLNPHHPHPSLDMHRPDIKLILPPQLPTSALIGTTDLSRPLPQVVASTEAPGWVHFSCLLTFPSVMLIVHNFG
jgi:hypothetical protein